MEPSNDEGGSQERTTATRAHRGRRQELARRANLPSTGVQAVRQRTRRETGSPSIRHPDAYENTDTGTALIQLIPTSVTESEGKNDKVHIVCDIATAFCATEDDLTNFVFHCGGAPRNQRGEHGLFSKLFNAAPNNGFTNNLKIRSSTLRCGDQVFPAPLFTGKLTFRKIPYSTISDEESIVAVSVRADLCLNMNRALNHQRAGLNNNSMRAIFKSVSPVALGLCGNDNLAPLQLINGEHDNARRHFFNAVIYTICEDLQRAASISERAGSGIINVTCEPNNFSLREVETCWDIGHSNFDALKALDDIRPSILERGGKRGWEGNAGTLTVECSQADRLLVYAKAANRIRFEIRHCPPKARARYSATTVTGMIDLLDEMRKSAAERLNHVLSFNAGPLIASASASEWETYAIKWGNSMGVSEPSLELYRLLRQHGYIKGGKFVHCIQGGVALLRKARDAGLLRHHHNAHRPVF